METSTLYGLKNRARQFYLILRKKLVKLGDKKFKLDTAVFELYTQELNDIVEHWPVPGTYSSAWESMNCFCYSSSLAAFIYDLLFHLSLIDVTHVGLLFMDRCLGISIFPRESTQIITCSFLTFVILNVVTVSIVACCFDVDFTNFVW